MKRTHSRHARRLRAIRPPIGAITTYARALRSWVEDRQAHMLAEMLSTWEHHLHRGRIRQDAKKRPTIRVQETIIDNVAARVSKKNARENSRLIGIPTNAIAETHVIEAFRQTNLDLIVRLGDTEVDRLGEILTEADRGAWRVEDLRAAIVQEFETTKAHADLIARDQVLKLNGQLTEMRQTAAGITEYIWTTSGDERVRSTHEELDGKRFSWADPPVTNEQGDTNNPGGDYQCRCTADPVIPGLDD